MLKCSIEATRIGKTKGSIYELRALFEDFRMQAVGGMKAGIDLYESCIVSSLLTNCGTWTEITEEEIKQLDELQNTLCRALLQLPLSTPKSSLRAAFGLVSMKFRVMEAKVLAREILEEQLAMGFPGLWQEVRQICVELGLPDDTRMDVQKEQVREAIQLNSLKELKAEMTGKIKIKELAMCDLRQPQSYFYWSVEDILLTNFLRLPDRLICLSRINQAERFARYQACLILIRQQPD